MIYDSLIEYTKDNYYPYHMPGHKRKIFGNKLDTIYNIDITEIDGFDNLHDAKDLIEEAQCYTSKVFGACSSYFLVNGSTAGILSAISAAVPKNGHILLARNSHKSAYHGCYLRELKVSYLYPTCDCNGIANGFSGDEIREYLLKYSDINAIFITSPTYEGKVSDIEAIVKVTKEFQIPLIIDEAHGAHFGFHPSWPKSSNYYGADLVIQSIHKTLPALTQTALLHCNSDLIDENRLKRFLRIYQSSSPSYPFMASIEQAVRMIEEEGQALFQSFKEQWENMLIKISVCKHISVVKTDDIGKLVLSVAETNISGKKLYEILLNKYKLQLELAAATYVIAMFTIADSAEGFSRLADAIIEIDHDLEASSSEDFGVAFYERQKRLELSEAWDMPTEIVNITHSIGKQIGEFVNLYPPGIPILVPGEIITEEDVVLLKNLFNRGLDIQGIINLDNMLGIKIIKTVN